MCGNPPSVESKDIATLVGGCLFHCRSNALGCPLGISLHNAVVVAEPDFELLRRQPVINTSKRIISDLTGVRVMIDCVFFRRGLHVRRRRPLFPSLTRWTPVGLRRDIPRIGGPMVVVNVLHLFSGRAEEGARRGIANAPGPGAHLKHALRVLLSGARLAPKPCGFGVSNGEPLRDHCLTFAFERFLEDSNQPLLHRYVPHRVGMPACFAINDGDILRLATVGVRYEL